MFLEYSAPPVNKKHPTAESPGKEAFGGLTHLTHGEAEDDDLRLGSVAHSAARALSCSVAGVVGSQAEKKGIVIGLQ